MARSAEAEGGGHWISNLRHKPARPRRDKTSSSFLRHLLVALLHRGFAREFHAAFVIDADALDPDFIPHLDDVLGLLDAEVRQFADVHQTVLAREDLYKTAEFFQRHHLAPIDL